MSEVYSEPCQISQMERFAKNNWRLKADTAWKVSKYGVFSGPNTGKYGPEKTLYLDTFHAVCVWTKGDYPEWTLRALLWKLSKIGASKSEIVTTYREMFAFAFYYK